MTKIKLCGISKMAEIETINELKPDYAGFVFASKSRRYVTPEKAQILRNALHPSVKTVGVFVNEAPELVAELLKSGMIDLAQLHGLEDEDYLKTLKNLTSGPVIQAFRIRKKEDLNIARKSSADFILLDAGAGDGKTFDWEWLEDFEKPYFLAGGLNPENVADAIRRLHPFGVDVSSGIETEGVKDDGKMRAFVDRVRATQMS